jgi:hypothetical protein
LTAAAEGKAAFEGYEGHGVFTWALLDALKNGDRNGNGTIELSELVAHVQDQVRKIVTKLNGRRLVAIAASGSTDNWQSARDGSMLIAPTWRVPESHEKGWYSQPLRGALFGVAISLIISL